MTPQTEIDFAGLMATRPAFEYSEQLAAAAREEFTEVSLCIAWVTESDGRAWRDWWDAQPEYVRNAMLWDYRIERDSATTSGRSMRPHALIHEEHERAFRASEATASKWAQDIKDAAATGKPMPFAEPEHGTGIEKAHYRYLIKRAFQIAGVVIVAQQPEQTKIRRRAA